MDTEKASGLYIVGDARQSSSVFSSALYCLLLKKLHIIKS